MTNTKPAWASEEVEAPHHIEPNIEEAYSTDLAATNHLKAIIALFPSLPEPCQRVIRANVEALAALIA